MHMYVTAAFVGGLVASLVLIVVRGFGRYALQLRAIVLPALRKKWSYVALLLLVEALLIVLMLLLLAGHTIWFCSCPDAGVEHSESVPTVLWSGAELIRIVIYFIVGMASTLGAGQIPLSVLPKGLQVLFDPSVDSSVSVRGAAEEFSDIVTPSVEEVVEIYAGSQSSTTFGELANSRRRLRGVILGGLRAWCDERASRYFQVWREQLRDAWFNPAEGPVRHRLRFIERCTMLTRRHSSLLREQATSTWRNLVSSAAMFKMSPDDYLICHSDEQFSDEADALFDLALTLGYYDFLSDILSIPLVWEKVEQTN